MKQAKRTNIYQHEIELKRLKLKNCARDEFRQGLLTIGVDLIWITDGKGYRRMKRSLRDAYIILPNIYNFYQTKKYLAADLATCIGI
ncbi:MAG: type II restriction endonuclease [Candidatus Desulfofervidaceae bacterium]|nr:type II restriction endonuclease [Candidatus Desulfofervidaceae bacterium]